MSNRTEPMNGAKDLPEYQQGFKAREKGKPRINPYSSGIREDAWWLGWDDCDALSRATRDAAEKFTADAAGKEFKPEGFREYPEDYFDHEELQDSDSYRDFVNQE